MHIIQNYTLKKMLLKNFAAGDGVASRDQESVRPSADDLDCHVRATAFHFSGSSGTTCTRTSFKNSIADSPIRGVNFRSRISPRIRSQNRNSSKASVRDLFFWVNCRY